MTPLDAEEIRLASKVDFEGRGFAADETPETLQDYIDEANAYLPFVTGRQLATMPVPLEGIAKRVIRMRVEQNVMTGTDEIAETASDFDLIGSFTAGSYTETRRTTGYKEQFPQINSWPEINRMLWGLMNTSAYPDDAVDAMYEYWMMLLNNITRPAWEIVEVDWGRGLGLAGEGSYGLGSGLPIENWPSY